MAAFVPRFVVRRAIAYNLRMPNRLLCRRKFILAAIEVSNCMLPDQRRDRNSASRRRQSAGPAENFQE
jgi:hypothetical protein